jgi:hypothetical protein
MMEKAIFRNKEEAEDFGETICLDAGRYSKQFSRL